MEIDYIVGGGIVSLSLVALAFFGYTTLRERHLEKKEARDNLAANRFDRHVASALKLTEQVNKR